MAYMDLLEKASCYKKTKHIIKNCQRIKKRHLICIMIYTNFDDLQYEYTKTYRKLNENESDNDIKKRHLEFVHLGKLLREAVETNGICVENGKTKTFFHGINRELLFTSTLAQFCGPISTSSEYEVAIKFTNNNGILLELNDGTLLSNQSKSMYFDCEWISDFGYEKEKFFIGGKVP
eukprot:424388_1